MRTSWQDGAIAQLGERCNGIAEVGGSIPLGSTKLSLVCIMALVGRVIFYIGLMVSVVGLIGGFSLMFQGSGDPIAKTLLMSVPIGFIVMFLGMSTAVMFAPPREDEK